MPAMRADRRHPWYLPDDAIPDVDTACRLCGEGGLAPIHRPPANRREFWLSFFGLLR